MGARNTDEKARLTEAAQLISDGVPTVEIRAHKITKRLARNLKGLFPGRDLMSPVHSIATLALKTEHRQSAMTEQMLAERASKQGVLVERMKSFRSHFDALGCWCDFIDPATGAPFNTDSATTLIECDEVYRQLGFEILELGCCRSLSCETFGQCVVMTSAFIQAPCEKLEAALPRLKQPQ